VAAAKSMYERVGGDPFFETLTLRFYRGVAGDALLRPLYPPDEQGFESSRLHLRDFLIQFWGGPPVYNETRGQPRLRMRHAHLAIGPAQRDAWVTHMTAAVRDARLKPLDETQMLGYLSRAATQLVNSAGQD